MPQCCPSAGELTFCSSVDAKLLKIVMPFSCELCDDNCELDHMFLNCMYGESALEAIFINNKSVKKQLA